MAAQISKNTKSVILVTHHIKKSGGCFVAFCPELLVTTQGNTVEEANNNLKEAITLHLETLDQLGIRDSVFKERNIIIFENKEIIKTKAIDLDLSKNKKSFITTQLIPLAS